MERGSERAQRWRPRIRGFVMRMSGLVKRSRFEGWVKVFALHVLVSKAVGHPCEVTDDQAPPHCSISHSAELGASPFSPRSSSASKLDIDGIARSWQVNRDESIALKSGCRLAARYGQILESSQSLRLSAYHRIFLLSTFSNPIRFSPCVVSSFSCPSPPHCCQPFSLQLTSQHA